MKNWTFYLILIIAIWTPSSMQSQSYLDVANFVYQYAEYSPKDASDFNFERFRLRLNPGFELNNEDYILTSLQTEVFKFKDAGYPGEDFDLYSSFISLGYLHFWNDKKWSLLTQVRFKLNSDYYTTEISDVQTGGWFLFTFNKNENVSLFAGLYYNQEVHKDLIFPIGGIHWKPDKKWNLYVLIPSTIRFEYELSENKWYAGLESDWNLNTYLIKGNRDIDYFRIETLVTSLFLEKHLTKELVIFARIGHHQINDFEAFKWSDELINQDQFQDKLFKNISLQTGLAYRLRFF